MFMVNGEIGISETTVAWLRYNIELEHEATTVSTVLFSVVENQKKGNFVQNKQNRKFNRKSINAID